MFLLKLSGPVHTVFTVTGTSTIGLELIPTVQIRETELPLAMNPFRLLVAVTIGVGTIIYKQMNIQMC